MLITKGAFKALLLAHGKLPRRLPRQQHPDQISLAYTRKVQGIMKWLHARVQEKLIPLLKAHAEQASRIATDAAETKFVVVIKKPDGSRSADLVSATEENASKAAGRIEAQSNGRWQTEVLPAHRVLADPSIEVNAAIRKKLVEGAATAEPDVIGSMIDELRAEFDRRYSRAKLAGIVDPFATQTADFQAEQLNRQLREAVSVDVVGGEPWLAKSIAEFTSENVSLIRTIPSRYFDEIETLVKREAADGSRWETLVDGIEERYAVSRSRSKIIARDQVGKFYGDLNRVRQEDVGITKFIWRTMRDNRVRPEHEMYDGNSYSWDSPPEGGPGEPILCRCYADPDLASVTAD